MKKHHLLMCAWVVVFLLATARDSNALESWDSCCGAVCLKVASGILGQEVHIADIRKHLQRSDDGNVSLLEISQAERTSVFMRLAQL